MRSSVKEILAILIIFSIFVFWREFPNSDVNRYNCPYWASNNPKLFREVGIEHSQTLIVCFIPGTLKAEMYLDMLENVINPTLIIIIEKDDRNGTENILFRQDATPPYYTMHLPQFATRYFKNGLEGEEQVNSPYFH